VRDAVVRDAVVRDAVVGNVRCRWEVSFGRDEKGVIGKCRLDGARSKRSE